MATTPFKPYWRPVAGPVLGEPADPYSWVFFVVAQIGGRHRPVAVVSSLGDNFNEEETVLRGYPLTAACHRIVTIFGDQSNHRAIRAELALATGYYMRDDDREYHPELVELPDLDRREHFPKRRNRNWDRISVREFPFISACLLQGVAFDTQQELSRPAFPEPLGTVYRDSSIEWGMVVIDITNLEAVGYGIIGFGVGPMTFISSANNRYPDVYGTGFAFVRGTLRVLDEVRPRRAMSAAEYMAKFEHTSWPTNNVNEVLAQVPLINMAAMDLVWPPGPEAGLSVDANRSLPDQDEAITNLVQSTLFMKDFDISIFDQARAMPNFREILCRVLLRNSARLGILSPDQLITMAFVDGEHLSLEQLNNLPVEAISAILGVPVMAKITSISFCIDRIYGTPAQLIDAISRVDRLRKLYFLQSPTQGNETLSARLFEELAGKPHILRRANVMLAGSYSAALRQRIWLPTVAKAGAVQVAPLDIFPVQQMLIKGIPTESVRDMSKYSYVHLGDALLKPERFVAGFMIYIQSLVTLNDEYVEQPVKLFCFSSAPSSLAGDPVIAAEVSPILAESFAVAPNGNDQVVQCWPQMRDLVPGGWTVIVSLEIHHASHALKSPYKCHCIRYAFVRACQQRIVVDRPPRKPPGPEALQVVGLKEFLGATAPEVDCAIVDQRLLDVAARMATTYYEGPLPPEERISVLSQADAADKLLEFLNDAKEVKESLREAMKEDPEERNWYPELLKKQLDTSQASTGTSG